MSTSPTAKPKTFKQKILDFWNHLYYKGKIEQIVFLLIGTAFVYFLIQVYYRGVSIQNTTNAPIPKIESPSTMSTPLGFYDWPKPAPGKSYYFLVLASVRATAILPEDFSTSYHIVYNLETKEYLAFRGIAPLSFGGRDFVYEITGGSDGARVFRVHQHEKANELMNRFGVIPGSTR